MSELPLILTIIVLSFLQQIYRSQAIAGAAASAAANQGQQQSLALLQQQQQHFVQQQLAGESLKAIQISVADFHGHFKRTISQLSLEVILEM